MDSDSLADIRESFEKKIMKFAPHSDYSVDFAQLKFLQMIDNTLKWINKQFCYNARIFVYFTLVWPGFGDLEQYSQTDFSKFSLRFHLSSAKFSLCKMSKLTLAHKLPGSVRTVLSHSP